MNTPYSVVDVQIVRDNYLRLSSLIEGEIFFAMKANSGQPVLDALAELGSSFDCASMGEINTILRMGVSPDRISYGNTIKKKRDIQSAYQAGVRLFVLDSDEELEKIAEVAPGSQVFVRILWEGVGADWALSRKFGCDPKMAVRLLEKASTMGLIPYGVSFHPGSQQRDPLQWREALQVVSGIFHELAGKGIDLEMVDIGGGLPSRGYRHDAADWSEYSQVINSTIDNLFPRRPRIIMEPGRALVGNCASVVAEVVLVSRKSDEDDQTWVYLDVGKFTGLAETSEEAILYHITVPGKEEEETIPCVLAGPTCDSLDILYERNLVPLPRSIRAGDLVTIHSVGAYFAEYSTVAFNGFSPPTVIYRD